FLTYELTAIVNGVRSCITQDPTHSGAALHWTATFSADEAETLGREVDRAAEVVGNASGPWMEGVAARPGGAVGQITHGSCVSACGEMLSGGLRTQQQLLNELGDWSNP